MLTNMNNRTKVLTLSRKLIPMEPVHLKIGAVMDTVNIRCIHPYKMTSSNSNHGGKCSMHRSVAQAGTAYVITINEYHIRYNEHLDVYHFI